MGAYGEWWVIYPCSGMGIAVNEETGKKVDLSDMLWRLRRKVVPAWISKHDRRTRIQMIVMFGITGLFCLVALVVFHID